MMRPVSRLAAIVLAFFAAQLLAASATGHELRPSLLSMKEIAPGDFDVSLRVSTLGPSRVHLSPVFPSRCRQVVPPALATGDGQEVTRYDIACGGSIGGETFAVEGLLGTANDVIVRLETMDGAVQTARLLPERPSFVVEDRPTAAAVLKTYGVLGIQHILLGLDHLLFVLALLVLIPSWRSLVATITSFTAAHSITLTLSALGLANAPQALVEALVALSIVFVAAEIVKAARPGGGGSRLRPWTVAFAFGLLHGLGFGGALREIGLPPGEVPAALLAFNVGVEMGQLAIVALALSTATSLRLLLATGGIGAHRWAGYAIGIVAATWFAQRLGGIVGVA